jgi:glycosyltransferase involved in cell wall biosynthesis
VRLAVVSSHPIQYYAPLFRKLATAVDLHVFFAHKSTAEDQARAEFGTAFEWDIDLTSGYAHSFLANVAREPGPHHFAGCDTPALKDRLREGRFDGVLLMGWHLKSFLQGLYAAKQIGIPVLVRGDSHLETPRSTLKRAAKSLVYPHFLRRFDVALYVGQRSRAYYEYYRFPAGRLFFSPHCVDADWFATRATADARTRLRAELGVRPETRLVLFAGKLSPGKRPTDLIEAAAIARSHGLDIEIAVAGDGVLRDALESKASQAKLPLHMLGFCNQSRMPAVYAASDCLVLPSESETWGLVANEALACGRPIIVSDACGCSPDLAVDGEAGRTFKTGDVSILARAIEAMTTNPPRSQAIAAVSNRHGLAAAVDGVVAALEYLHAARPHALTR